MKIEGGEASCCHDFSVANLVVEKDLGTRAERCEVVRVNLSVNEEMCVKGKEMKSRVGEVFLEE